MKNKYKFIFGNPPFQDSKNRKKTQHKLWIDFTLKYFNNHLEDEGAMVWLTPSSWGSPSSKILKLFKENNVELINLDISHYFPKIGSTFSFYKITKEGHVNKTDITTPDSEFKFEIDNSVKYIPNDFCRDSMSIHKKVIFGKEKKFSLGYDYVTCHNVIRHKKKLLQKKIKKCETDISVMPNSQRKETKKEKLKQYKEELKNCFITVSETKTKDHVYPILHTNTKTWYSSLKQTFATKQKVMWSRSGYTKPFFDNGQLGCTDMGYYILVNSEKEGRRLEKFLNSKLMQYIFKTAKWSGFGNELVFSSIPQIDLSVDYSELDYYKLFNISKQEIEFIERSFLPKKRKAVKRGSSETKSKKRVKELGEVYTPTELVRMMLDTVPDDEWSKKDATFVDPACGNGNFIVEIVKKKILNGLSIEEAVGTTYGIDIMEDNISECKQRILKFFKDNDWNITDKVVGLLDKNIVLADAMTLN